MIYIQLILLVAILALLIRQQTGKNNKTSSSQRQVILDTCALIDGRINDLVQSGFVPEEIVIPQFILRELQGLADGSDPHKRERARFGLDVVKQLQNSKFGNVIIDRTDFSSISKTDDKLVALAKKQGALLYTTDYNLNKVADIEGVRVLNVNELAQHLRPVALPGEVKKIKILQKGSNRNQGVGYLDDGTMVVVDDAARFIGHEVSVEVTRTHQTVAGKMIFGTMLAVPVQPKNIVNRLRDNRQHPQFQKPKFRKPRIS